MGDRKFKAGDKVKFPKTKSAYNNYLGFLKEVQRICTVHPTYLVVVKEHGTDTYILDIPMEFSMNELTNKVFHENDLELYVDTKSGMVGSEWDDAELFKTQSGLDKVIVVNPTNKYTEEFNRLTESEESYASYIVEESIKSLEIIADKDLAFYLELENLIKYLASTYSDKYEETSKNIFHPKEGLTKEVALWNASKYLRRYSTTGYEKSENTKDVLKAIHYLLMENKRKNGN